MTTDQKLEHDTLDATVNRVLDGSGTEQDAKTVALWSRKMLAWLRARAAEAQR
jgi:hypothetical protein